LSLAQNGLDYLFVRSLTWVNDWPVIGSSTQSGSLRQRAAKREERFPGRQAIIGKDQR
jgi:hypothetical protein